jgi:polyferredoxin
VRNAYTIKIMNMKPEPRTFDLGLVGLPGGLMWSPDVIDEPARRFALDVPPDAVRSVRVSVKAPPGDLADVPAPFSFRAFDMNGRESAETSAVFEAPR